jgi:hypothetical protein
MKFALRNEKIHQPSPANLEELNFAFFSPEFWILTPDFLFLNPQSAIQIPQFILPAGRCLLPALFYPMLHALCSMPYAPCLVVYLEQRRGYSRDNKGEL